MAAGQNLAVAEVFKLADARATRRAWQRLRSPNPLRGGRLTHLK
jgi:hypothetical protein